MTRKFLKTSLAAFVLFSICTAVPSARAEANASEEAAVRKVVANWDTCFGKKDAHGCAMVFAEDGELTTVRGETTRGRADLEKHFQTVFGTFLKNAQRMDKVRSVRFLTPMIAAVDTEFKLSGATSPNGVEAAPPVREGLLMWIVTKHDGRWYISIFHELDYPGK